MIYVILTSKYEIIGVGLSPKQAWDSLPHKVSDYVSTRYTYERLRYAHDDEELTNRDMICVPYDEQEIEYNRSIMM